jgi:hypothetical protein
MELVANIWPIFDKPTGVIHRFAARAYAIQGDDSAIGATLRNVAQSDYVLAKQYLIPKRFTLVSPHGKMKRAVLPDTFNANTPNIIEDALRDLEKSFPPMYSVVLNRKGAPYNKLIKITFPEIPYLVVTFLAEDHKGRLTPNVT